MRGTAEVASGAVQVPGADSTLKASKRSFDANGTGMVSPR
jgi:hypothetical protein